VAALDMSGFTRVVKQYGAVHYIAMIKRMQDQVDTAVENAGGKVIKYDADNMAAVFDDVEAAIHAAKETLQGIAFASMPDGHGIEAQERTFEISNVQIKAQQIIF
jgi:class 3 adenylate cyclase